MKRLRKLLPIAMVVAMLLVLAPARVAFAATLLDVSDVLGSNTASSANITHTVRLTIPSGGSALTASSNISIALTGFTVASGYDGTVTVTDDGASVDLDSGDNYDVSSQTITIKLDEAIAAGSLVKIVLAQSANAANTIDNPVAGIYTVTVTTSVDSVSASDTDSCTVPIESDTVNYQFGVNVGSIILATVNATLTDDITLGTGKMSITLDTTWQAVDATGDGNGWTITVSVGSLTDGTKTLSRRDDRTFTGNTEYAVEVLTTQSLDFTQTVANDGSTAVSDLAGTNSWTYVDSDGITIVTATSGEGMGRYTHTPHFRFTIPVGAYADDGSNYVVTMTIDIVDV